MIFLCDSGGTIQAAIPSPIHQGSIGVNEIILIAPFPSSTVVTATFTLPNGIKIYPKYVSPDGDPDYPYLMAVVNDFAEKKVTIDGVTANVWRLTLDKAITQVSGNVTIQFIFSSVGGINLTSSSATLPVLRGNAYLAPTVTLSDLELVQQYLAAALAAVEAAEDAEQGARDAARTEINLILNRLEYDHVITTKAELLTLPTLTGRILIDGPVLNETLALSVNQSCSLIKMQSTTINSGNSLTLYGHSGCRIEGGAGVVGALAVDDFEGVSGFPQSTPLTLYDCRFVSRCYITRAEECTFIDNCYVSGAPVAFINCEYICGIYDYSGTAGQVQFNNCSYISNVSTNATYTGCLFVDDTTCKGYVRPVNVGGVRKITTDGSFVVGKLPANISLSINASTYELTATLTDENGTVIATSNVVDLPLEQMIADVTYDPDKDALIITLNNGNTTEVPLSDIISGLATEDYVNNLLKDYYTADEVDRIVTELPVTTVSIIDDVLTLSSPRPTPLVTISNGVLSIR